MTVKLTPAQIATLRLIAEAPAGSAAQIRPRQAAALARAGYLIAESDAPLGFALTSVGQEAVAALAIVSGARAPDEHKGKLGAILRLLKRDRGASLVEMMEATGWQAHSVRGALAGSIKKRRGIAITSEKIDGQRVYRALEATS